MVLLDKNHPYEQNIVKELFGEKVNVIPIGSDVTDLWINELKEKSQFEPLEIAGLTTESLFVCLQQLLDRENSTKFEIARVNRDLFKWKIYSNPQKTNWRQAV